ncbi:uncharacterized protein TRIADDRAFT_5191, partial [Trichoplax adhaerens]
TTLNAAGFIFNSIVMAYIIRNRYTQNAVNYLVGNLILSNILNSFQWSCGNIYVAIVQQAGWSFALMNIICKFSIYFWLVCYTASVGTLKLLSIERYRAIIHPLNPRLHGRKLIIILVILWLFAIIISLPVLYSVAANEILKYDCIVNISQSIFHLVHIIFLNFIDYILPVCVMIYCYTKVIIKLRKTSVQALRNKKLSAGERRKKRVVKMSIILTVCFIISALPW